MRPLAPLLLSTAALAAPAPALAAWSAPVTLNPANEANMVVAPDGSVITGWLQPVAYRYARAGAGFGAGAPLNAADPYEKVLAAGGAADGGTVLLTLRKHKPTQRVRAIVGAHSAARTISDFHHSAVGPVLAVAADGTAVAAWLWHDPAGWTVQAAIRRPGQPRFDKPQTLSPPAPRNGRFQTRPTVKVAAGAGGRAVLVWQIPSAAEAPEYALHVTTAGADAVFGNPQELPDGGDYADSGLAISAAGEVQVAYLGEHFTPHEAPASLHVTQGAAGAPLPAPAVLSSGGTGTSDGSQVTAAYAADGSATVAWIKPGTQYENSAGIEVFTRPAGGAFGPAQPIAAPGSEGLVAAGGPGASGALSWMQHAQPSPQTVDWSIHAATRPQAGGAFGAAQALSDPSRDALWPALAMTASGDAIDLWGTNASGGGSGAATAAIHAAD